MISKSLILLALTSFALAIPQDVDTSTSSESTDTAEFADVNDLLAALASIPILDPSAQEALATAIPEVDLTSPEVQCNPSAASWYGDLSSEVQTALTTYVNAVQSWVVAHPDIVENYAASLPSGFALCEKEEEPTTSSTSGVPTSTGSSTSSEVITGTASTTSSGIVTGTASTPGTSSATLSSSSGIVDDSSTTIPASASPLPTSALFSTSTIYATLTSTISSCASTITACPYGSVTTVTVAVSTTICPVTDISQSSAAQGNGSQTSVAGGAAIPTGSFTVSTRSGVAGETAAGPTASSAPFQGTASRASGSIFGGLICVLGVFGALALW